MQLLVDLHPPEELEEPETAVPENEVGIFVHTLIVVWDTRYQYK